MRARRLLTVLLAALLAACAAPTIHDAGSGGSEAGFAHDIDSETRPWNHGRFDADEDKFTFAIFSDLTGGEREGVFSVAAEQLRLLRPEFVIGVGDLIEGGSEDRGQLKREWESFDSRAARPVGPVFHVGGNHDLINPVQWDVWQQRYGPRFYHFVYRNVLFLVLDTEDNPAERQQELYEMRVQALERVAVDGWGIYTQTEYTQMQETHTGTIGAKQSEYFQDVIARHPAVRWTFLFLHKPAWLKPGEENFIAIEDALAGRPYTVFNGHNHDYVYRSRRGRDYIQLGTTGGVQLPGKQKAIDHLTLVTVSDSGVDIANLELAGIFDKTGRVPLNGEELCFANCVGE